MSKKLLDMLKEGVVLGDGGMFLEARWRGYQVPGLIGTHPDALRQIHRDFYRAGSQALQALTWFTSGSQLERWYGWTGRVDEINRTAIRAAKEASGGKALVGGCLVSTRTGSWEGAPIFDPDDPSSYDRAKAEWDQQIAILVDAGADFLIPETFARLDEVRLCLQCCKKTNIPTMVLMGLGSRTETQDGVSAAECARILAGDGADVVGTVCIGDPGQMLPTALKMREAVDVPVACQPKGHREGRRFEVVPPEEMAGFALKAKAEGINYIGACCGAGPWHIRAMAQALGIPENPV